MRQGYAVFLQAKEDGKFVLFVVVVVVVIKFLQVVTSEYSCESLR